MIEWILLGLLILVGIFVISGIARSFLSLNDFEKRADKVYEENNIHPDEMLKLSKGELIRRKNLCDFYEHSLLFKNYKEALHIKKNEKKP